MQICMHANVASIAMERFYERCHMKLYFIVACPWPIQIGTKQSTSSAANVANGVLCLSEMNNHYHKHRLVSVFSCKFPCVACAACDQMTCWAIRLTRWLAITYNTMRDMAFSNARCALRQRTYNRRRNTTCNIIWYNMIWYDIIWYDMTQWPYMTHKIYSTNAPILYLKQHRNAQIHLHFRLY